MKRSPIIRTWRRRRAAREKWLRAVGFGALAVCGLAYLLLGIGLVPTAEAAVSLGVGLPDVARIEQIFADPLQDGYPSIQILDRSGNQILLEAMHPASAERRWVRADASALQRGQLPFLLAGLDLAEAEPASVTPALGGAWLRRLCWDTRAFATGAVSGICESGTAAGCSAATVDAAASTRLPGIRPRARLHAATAGGVVPQQRLLRQPGLWD